MASASASAKVCPGLLGSATCRSKADLFGVTGNPAAMFTKAARSDLVGAFANGQR
jgi:hypothetical protein